MFTCEAGENGKLGSNAIGNRCGVEAIGWTKISASGLLGTGTYRTFYCKSHEPISDFRNEITPRTKARDPLELMASEKLKLHIKLLGDPSGKLTHNEHFDTEADFLAAYQVKDYPRPSVTVDLVIFTIVDSILKVLLIRRGGHPFKGSLALPGGFLNVGDAVKDQGEDLEAAAHRELEEETNLPRGSCYLEQLYTFGKAGRDPRTRVVSVAYMALIRPTLAPFVRAGDDAVEASWFPITSIQEGMAFDHAEILKLAVQRLQGKIDYAPIAFDLVPETFTATELRMVYETVKGKSYDPKNFYRRFRRMLADGVLTEASGKRATGTNSAKVYRFNRV